MTRELMTYLAERNARWNVNNPGNGLISIECKECRISPDAIRAGIYGFMNLSNLEFISEESCPIAGISIGSKKFGNYFIQVSVHNRAYATVTVETF